MSGGQLILAATPLGNILDASPRLKETLEQADLIAAEDTRRAKRLFADLNLEITAPVISLFEENEIEKIPDKHSDSVAIINLPLEVRYENALMVNVF
jgi:16S rRNA (cytidine1402-2'-O)-methyltransferase